MKTILLYKYYFLRFFILGFLVYFPMLFNGFVWDDLDLIINYPQIHQLNITIFFDNYFNTASIYRQILVLYDSIMYNLFKTNPFPYHLIQLLLHIACTSIIFVLFTNYFRTWLSFLLSLIFLVHPVNVESVAWISITENQLYVISGVAALLVAQKKVLSEKNIYFICTSLFISLLTYETGIFFIVLVLFVLFIKKSPVYKSVLFLNLLLVFFYFFLRFIANALHTSYVYAQPYVPETLFGKIQLIPSIIMHYMGTYFYPTELMILKYWIIQSIDFKNVILPTISVLGFIGLYIYYFLRQEKKGKNTLLFFTLWFILGLLPLLQLIPLTSFVADRWFYFPSIGLLGIIGFLIQQNVSHLKKFKYVFLGIFIIVFVLLSLRTNNRIYDWKDTYTLFKHDLQYQPDNAGMNYYLGSKYVENKKYKEAIPYLQKAVDVDPHSYSLFALAMSYDSLGDYENASKYYLLIRERSWEPIPEYDPDINFALTRIYLLSNNYEEIVLLLTDPVIDQSSNKILLLYARAKANYELKNYDKALPDAEYIVGIASDQKIQELYTQIKAAINE